MGWASGSRIAEELWRELKPYLEPEDYGAVSKILIDRFCELDADDWTMDSVDCLFYFYLKYNNPEELKEYDFE